MALPWGNGYISGLWSSAAFDGAGLTVKRRRGMVTVDNERYGRYSSEVQILLADLEADSRVNCCGQISEEDMWKLDFYRQGLTINSRKLQKLGRESAVGLFSRKEAGKSKGPVWNKVRF